MLTNLQIAFISNFFNHHEKPLCDELYKMTNGGFQFIQTSPVDNERIGMGWGTEWNEVSYLRYSYGSEKNEEDCKVICIEADVLIFGSAPYDFIAERVKYNKLTFFYAERLFKKGFWRAFYPPSSIRITRRFVIPGSRSNFHMLCASGYTAYDVSRIKSFTNRTYRWAHFTEFIEHDLAKLMLMKEGKRVNILWVGRLIKLKHPEYTIQLAKSLKNDGFEFELDIIGNGEMEEELARLISSYGLSTNVMLRGAMKPDEVRDFMERSNIFISTSDFNEGWGAVLTEAMNSGCAVVASHAIGSVPFLLEHHKNGFIYKNGEFTDFYEKVLILVKDPLFRKEISINAYNSISSIWNAKTGAERLISLSTCLLKGESRPVYENGPCSLAPIITNKWFCHKQD